MVCEAVVLHNRTPVDVLTYLKDFHNRWHSGSGTTFLELICTSLDIDKSWLAFARPGWVSQGR